MSNLPIKYKENIFKRILNFFRIKSKRYNQEIEMHQNENGINYSKKSELRESLQSEYEIIKENEQLVQDVVNNPDLIYTYSDDKLRKLIDILDDKILELDTYIYNMEKQFSNVENN